MANRPVICHIIVGVAIGGAERCLSDIVAATEEIFDHRVLFFDRSPDADTRIAIHGIPIQYVTVNPANPLSWIKAVYLARREVREHEVHLVQGWMYLGNLLSSLVVTGMQQPPAQAWNIRSNVTDLTEERWTTRVAIRLAGLKPLWPDLAIYNSHAAQAGHAQFGFGDIPDAVIVNGIDLTRYAHDTELRQQVRQAHGIGHDESVIGMIARYDPVKDLGTFFRAIKQVLTQRPPTRVLLIGPGMEPENAQLMELMAVAGVDPSQVILFGPTADVPRDIQALDVLVVSSRREGTPNVILEALASGVGCVSTRVGDAPRMLDNGARICDVGDHSGLAECINQALDAQGRWADGDRQRLKNEYSMDACISKYRETYARLLGS
ncbi:MAG: glycosyltransferase [Pseudomonadota bacterium]